MCMKQVGRGGGVIIGGDLPVDVYETGGKGGGVIIGGDLPVDV